METINKELALWLQQLGIAEGYVDLVVTATSIFVILHILVKHELFTARIISLFVYSRKPLSTHVNKCVSVTSGKSP